MKAKLLLVLAATLLAVSPALGADSNQDGLDDRFAEGVSPLANRDGEMIAIVNTGDGSVGSLLIRLSDLGYTPAIIPVDSGFDVLVGYNLVCLPVGHGMVSSNAIFAGLAQDYHDYVGVGGGLWIGQPNPNGMPDNTTDVSWAPYELTVQSSYSFEDCPAAIVSQHCLTLGLADEDMPFPADNAIAYGPEWEVIVVGSETGRPAVFFASYGQGNVLVELGHPSPVAICSASDACLDRFVQCTLSQPVENESSSWGGVKALFR